MTRHASAELVAIVMMGAQMVMANSGPIQFLDSIHGNSFLAIQSTMEVFQRRKLDLARSRFEVARTGDSLVVILTEQHGPGKTREKVGVSVETKMELSPQDLAAVISNTDRYLLVDHILGSNLVAVQTAVRVFAQHQPDLRQYKIDVIRDGDALAVLFADKDRPPGIHGSVGQAGFEVELNAQDMTVVRSNFVR
jgi:hypothetical protein